MSKISGFPELTPNEQLVETGLENKLHNIYKLFGFDEVRMRSVEPVSTLQSKGETSKEIYLLTRLQEAVENNQVQINLESQKQLGLRFDLTVPFARYIEDNFDKLTYPFKRYSIGKVWRGERPQAGRFREFTQADVDIINNGELDIKSDIQIVEVVIEALKIIFPQTPFLVHANNRGLLNQLYKNAGIKNFEETLRVIDKLSKIGSSKVIESLESQGEDIKAIEKCLDYAKQKFTCSKDLYSAVGKTEVSKELGILIDSNKKIIADLSIARGLDYYNGNVFETYIEGQENYGAIASGGRYNNLVKVGKNNLQGVGMSIGLSRILSLILQNNDIKTQNNKVMIIAPSNDYDEQVKYLSNDIRFKQNIPCDISPNFEWKIGKQIDFASKKGCEKVYIIQDDNSYTIKNIITGDQKELSFE